jgi:aspartate beta-hydroxylase
MGFLYDTTAAVVRRHYDRRLATPSVLDPVVFFPSAGRFTAAWEGLRDEAARLQLSEVPRFHEIMSQQADISANDGRDWRMFIAKAYGVPMAANLARCPILAGLLADCPEVLSASFSFLAPGKHIPCHRGPFRGILRYQLSLTMPLDADGEPAAVLMVDSVPHRIAAGTGLLWDDTFPHEVFNRSAQVRAALLLDVRRPSQPFDLAAISAVVIAAVATAVRVDHWKKARGSRRNKPDAGLPAGDTGLPT